MSVIPTQGDGKITVPALLNRKSDPASQKIVCLTAYDYPTSRLADQAGVDVLLVGDSLGMVVLGYDNTLPVTLDEMIHHTRAVRRGTKHALVVADMPFGTYHADISEALRNAVRQRPRRLSRPGQDRRRRRTAPPRRPRRRSRRRLCRRPRSRPPRTCRPNHPRAANSHNRNRRRPRLRRPDPRRPRSPRPHLHRTAKIRAPIRQLGRIHLHRRPLLLRRRPRRHLPVRLRVLPLRRIPQAPQTNPHRLLSAHAANSPRCFGSFSKPGSLRRGGVHSARRNLQPQNSPKGTK
jgi:hypothetical protein